MQWREAVRKPDDLRLAVPDEIVLPEVY